MLKVTGIDFAIIIMLSSVMYAIIILNFIIMTDQLFPNHLQQVLDLVWGARAKYYNIGLGLALPSGTIDAIVSGNSHKPDPIFTEMIKECLTQGLVTQKKLAKAVSSQQVGFAYMSDGILAEKFTAPQTPECKNN